MDKSFKNSYFLAFILFLALFLGVFSFRAEAAFNGNSSGYAWGEKTGWISFETTTSYGVEVADSTIDGYAWGEKTGYISLYRDSGTPGYGVTVTLAGGTAKLSGDIWSEKTGWIRLAASGSDYGNTTAANYGVTINGSTGAFSGYAWGEKTGWIKFSGSCSSGSSGICSGGVYGVTTSWRDSTPETVASGTLESNTIDIGSGSGAALNYIIWQGTQPTGTGVKFQIASSDSSSGPWSYVGSDGTDATYYTPSGPGVAVAINQANHLHNRYFRYKIFISSDGGQTVSPTITDVIVNFTP